MTPYKGLSELPLRLSPANTYLSPVLRFDTNTFLRAMSMDEGTYVCIAENRVGKVEASASLTVRGKKL